VGISTRLCLIVRKKGGDASKKLHGKFREAMEDCDLHDLGFVGMLSLGEINITMQLATQNKGWIRLS
jgi:hypothetical protein